MKTFALENEEGPRGPRYVSPNPAQANARMGILVEEGFPFTMELRFIVVWGTVVAPTSGLWKV